MRKNICGTFASSDSVRLHPDPQPGQAWNIQRGFSRLGALALDRIPEKGRYVGAAELLYLADAGR